jgi:hypothetical protein
MTAFNTETKSSDPLQHSYDSVHAGQITARKFHTEKRRHSDTSVMTSSPRDVTFRRLSMAESHAVGPALMTSSPRDVTFSRRPSNEESNAVGPALTLEAIKQHSKSTAAKLLDGGASKPQKQLKPRTRKSEDMQKTGKMSELQMRRFTLFFFGPEPKKQSDAYFSALQ